MVSILWVPLHLGSDLCSKTNAQVLLAHICITLVHAAFHTRLRGANDSSVLLPVALVVI